MLAAAVMTAAAVLTGCQLGNALPIPPAPSSVPAPQSPSTAAPQPVDPSAESGAASATPPGPAPTTAPDGAMDRASYPVSDAAIVNPERGWHGDADLTDPNLNLDGVREQGNSLVRSYVRLDDYRDRPLDQEFLDRLDAGLGSVRDAGVKVVLRFAYNFGIDEPDAPETVVLQHIEQLTPVLRANADVITVVQAGFIGAWGEWHSSTNGLTEPSAQQRIADALLASLPANRSIQIRYPAARRAVAGAPLTTEQALAGGDAARVGIHNDCFLASDEDWGTYDLDGIEEGKAEVAAVGAYAPVGGETCNFNPPRSDCPTAIAELSAQHWSYLTEYYHPEVLASWREQGCADDVSQRLGYRVHLTDAAWASAPRVGQEMPVQVSIANTGWAAPYNPRPVFVTLQQGEQRVDLPLAGADPQRWAPGQVTTVNGSVQLPANLAPGTYQVSLWLPDEAPGLRSRPEYSLQLANTGTWNPVDGTNLLTDALTITRP